MWLMIISSGGKLDADASGDAFYTFDHGRAPSAGATQASPAIAFGHDVGYQPG